MCLELLRLWIPLKFTLDAARLILAEYELLAMLGGPVLGHFVGVSLSRNFMLDMGQYIMSRTLDTYYLYLQKKVSQAYIDDAVANMGGAVM